ncbi:hypothetical protein L596_022108 [Steinernema carpocapsae]|uniref:Uncharacterized protein n=1 Tax=Steinernema carpocapsae TaxID=34508 RepID=A0A4U5MKU7_STECR|nr:hypothetical protein L596_022108 [Steinernema carpocapsae]
MCVYKHFKEIRTPGNTVITSKVTRRSFISDQSISVSNPLKAIATIEPCRTESTIKSTGLLRVLFNLRKKPKKH